MHDANKPTPKDGTSGAAGPSVEHPSAQAVTPPDAAPVETPVEMADVPVVLDLPAEPASVHVIVMRDRTRIVVSGEVDADLSADLQEATSDAEATGLPIEVDAQHVTFMDSSGIAFLARLASRSAERVRVLHAPETVRFLLEVTKIGDLLDLVDEPEAGEPDADAPDHGLPTIPRPTPPDVVA
ncbi:STAS domain-containing protein [Actinotalea fermentans]|uniref:STAS domain-containing protein n=1 Tax=Actinotalea fermentans TaxID=43671 RepID=A0A511YYS9_9CELL|nr:STAS domain-containing protein [Actinotalea fermentans]KGM14754.1 hypothetical protein N867_16340 [Actinotalea fermentans ATCC 43279 = JCM 9966 = DSM 3133]GEN80365.1 hypothetical protein AFE02nite_20990 [Actinotalea fermentans]